MMRGKAAAYLASLPPLEDRLNAFMRGLRGAGRLTIFPVSRRPRSERISCWIAGPVSLR